MLYPPSPSPSLSASMFAFKKHFISECLYIFRGKIKTIFTVQTAPIAGIHPRRKRCQVLAQSTLPTVSKMMTLPNPSKLMTLPNESSIATLPNGSNRLELERDWRKMKNLLGRWQSSARVISEELWRLKWCRRVTRSSWDREIQTETGNNDQFFHSTFLNLFNLMNTRSAICLPAETLLIAELELISTFYSNF
jgi:hypothetical protein